MKYLIIILLIAQNTFSQPGKYAGSKKNLIGITYFNNNLDNKVKGWTYKGGSVLNDVNDNSGFTISITLYQKGTSQLAFLSKSESNSEKSTVYDVIETTNVPKNYEIYIGTCRKNKINNVEIVALVKVLYTEYLTQVNKAWRCNMDKMQFEFLDKKGIDCLFEGLN